MTPIRHRTRVAAALAIGVAAASSAAWGQYSRPTALVGARLIDGRGGPPVETATVVFKEGVIVAAGDSATVAIPDDARVFRVLGKTVMPGLIDTHVHIASSGGGGVDEREFKSVSANQNLRSQLRYGVTTVMDLGGNPFIEGLKESIAAGRIIGPRLFGVRYAITSPGAHPLGFLRDQRLDKLLAASYPTVETVERAWYWTRRAAAEKADAVKIFHTSSEFPGTTRLGVDGPRFAPKILETLVAAAHFFKRKAFVHVALPGEAHEAMRAGADVIAGAIGLGETGVDTAFKLMAKRGAAYVPTLAQIEAIYAGPVEPKALAKLRGRVWSVVLDSIADPEGFVRKRRRADGIAAASRDQLRIARANLRRAVAAGVRIVMGTGAGNPGVMHGWAAPRELELMTQSGMSPMQAIVAATRNAAEVIGQGDKLGTIEPGKLADMIVVSGDPLKSISAVRDIDLVVRGGYAFDPAGIRIK